MGYGEVGGGGSVKWLVIHGNGKANHDKDAAPKYGGDFKVVIKAGSNLSEAKGRTKIASDGTVTVEFPIQDDPHQILINWPST